MYDIPLFKNPQTFLENLNYSKHFYFGRLLNSLFLSAAYILAKEEPLKRKRKKR